MDFINETDAILIHRRSGTGQDPHILLTHSLMIKDNKVLLKEIPDKSYKVKVTGENTTWSETQGNIKTENQYKVDYTFGFIEFHPTKNGLTLQFQYYGTGVSLFPQSRVYVNESDEFYGAETLEEFGKELISRITSSVNKDVELDQRLNNIIAQSGNNITEIVDARVDTDGTIHLTMNARIGSWENKTKAAQSEILQARKDTENVTHPLLKDRLFKWENKFVVLNSEIVTSRTDRDGTVHATLSARFNKNEQNYNDLKVTVGTLSGLQTTSKLNLVAAINEVNTKSNDNKTSIGTLSNLKTTNKTNVVSAINEQSDKMGDFTKITETNLIDAIKANKDKINSIRYVTPEQFGAKGDWNGISGTDDTDAFQAAIDFFGGKGGTVLCDSKQYKISRTLLLKDNVSIEGQGHAMEGTHIYYTGLGYCIQTTGNHMRQQIHKLYITLNNNNGIRIGDIGDRLDSSAGILPRQIGISYVSISGLTGLNYGIRIENASHINVVGVRSGYSKDASGGIGVSIWQDYRNSGVMSFTDCSFGRVNETEIGLELDATRQTGLDSLNFNGCYFGGKKPIVIGKTQKVRNVTFNNSHIEGKGGSPTNLVELYNASGISFNGATLVAFGEITTNGFSFKGDAERVNLLGIEANEFKGYVYINEGGYNLSNSIIQEPFITGQVSPATIHNGNFEYPLRLTQNKLVTKNIQAQFLYSGNGNNKMDWGSQSPASDSPAIGWTRGDERRNTLGAELGTSGNKYVISGWKCISSGTPGTWVEMRNLTGN